MSKKVSINEIVDERLVFCDMDIFSSDDNIEDIYDFKIDFDFFMKRAKNYLVPKQIRIIKLYFGIGKRDPMLMRDIAKKENVSKLVCGELKYRGMCLLYRLGQFKEVWNVGTKRHYEWRRNK